MRWIILNRRCLFAACYLLLWRLCVGDITPHSRIHVAIDKHVGRYPNIAQNLSHELMEFRLIDRPNELKKDVDVIAHADWKAFRRYFKSSTCPIYQYVENTATTMALLEDKKNWKSWMTANNLGMHIPTTLNDSNPALLEFPVVLKITLKHGGNGVHIVPNMEKLQNLTAMIKEHNYRYFIEESLTGLGMGEMCGFGSVFQGKLLSLRCYQRSFTEHNIRTSKFGSGFNSTAHAVGPVYVKAGSLMPDEDHLVPCSKDVVRAVTAMFALTNYTGPYCTDWKLDRHMRPKMMEVNARMCGTLSKPYGDPIVVATFVPLAFAILQANPDPAYHARSALLHSPHKEMYQRILAEEQRALQTGGGWYQGQWVEAEHYDMHKRLTPLLETYRAGT